MKNSRTAFSLVEVIIALVLIAGPLSQIFSLMRSNALASRVNDDHVTMDTIVVVLLERLCTTPAATIDALPRSQYAGFLQQLIDAQVESLPASMASSYRKRIAGVIRKMSLSIQKNVGNHTGLYQFAVTVESTGGAMSSGSRMVMTAGV